MFQVFRCACSRFLAMLSAMCVTLLVMYVLQLTMQKRLAMYVPRLIYIFYVCVSSIQRF